MRKVVLIGIGLLLVVAVVLALGKPPGQGAQSGQSLATPVAGLNQATGTLGAVSATSGSQVGDAVATLQATARGGHPATATPAP